MKKDFLYNAAEKIFIRFIEKDKSGRLFSKRVSENLERLYPFSGKEKAKDFYIQKIRLSMLIGISGIFLAVGLFISEGIQPPVKDNQIYRQGYRGNTQEIPVKVTIDDKEEHELVLEVGKRLYSREQLEKLYEAAVKELEKVICGENDSLEYVDKDLCLVPELSGYPFRIEWESLNHRCIDMEGKLYQAEIPAEGTMAGLNAIFTCEDFRAEYLFYVQIYPEILTEGKTEEQKILESVQRAEEQSREQEILLLPSELEGRKLTWESLKSKTWAAVVFLALAAAAAVYFLKDEDLEKEKKKRELQMRLAYPEMVSKLSIYLGAGMTVRGAWEKICVDYGKRKPEGKRSHVYEEMQIAVQEMKSGISEMSAYERFGKRCSIQLYSKFSSLLTQNLRKGSTKLGPLLKEESRLAFEERKNAARKAGEEAGTKLLLPMMMMLCVVMLMILLPAFMTF